MVRAGALQGSGGPGGVVALPLHRDPFAPRREDRSFRRLLIASLALHLVFLAVFWETLLGVVIQEEETVTVRVLDEKKPEPPKLRPKLLAQRQVDTSVRRFKEVVQQEIVEVRPEVLDSMQKIEVDPLERTVAPKTLEQRKIVAERVSVFADVPRRVEPIQIDTATPSVRQVHVAKAAAGPRKVEAAGPRYDPEAVDLAPQVTEGKLSRSVVEGDLDGARIAALESGASDRFLRGGGQGGTLGGAEADCMHDPICLAYLEMIKERVYARWHVPPDVTAGKVKLSFRIDRGGSAHGIRQRHADDPGLGQTCVAAFRHASPFPPPPEKIRYLVNKGLIATFSYGN